MASNDCGGDGRRRRGQRSTAGLSWTRGALGLAGVQAVLKVRF